MQSYHKLLLQSLVAQVNLHAAALNASGQVKVTFSTDGTSVSVAFADIPVPPR